MRLAVIGSTNGTDLVPIVSAINSGELLASVEVIISNWYLWYRGSFYLS
jgi:folate-dependent phosphoribosylglycinamide formyltransferase PurN